MSKYTYPGVYIEEVSSPIRAISGASTSVTAFVGPAENATGVSEPTLVNSFAEFERKFGSVGKSSFLYHAIDQYYRCGGRSAVIVSFPKSNTDSSNKPEEATGIKSEELGDAKSAGIAAIEKVKQIADLLDSLNEDLPGHSDKPTYNFSKGISTSLDQNRKTVDDIDPDNPPPPKLLSPIVQFGVVVSRDAVRLAGSVSSWIGHAIEREIEDYNQLTDAEKEWADIAKPHAALAVSRGDAASTTTVSSFPIVDEGASGATESAMTAIAAANAIGKFDDSRKKLVTLVVRCQSYGSMAA